MSNSAVSKSIQRNKEYSPRTFLELSSQKKSLLILNFHSTFNLEMWLLDHQHQCHWEFLRNANHWAPSQTYYMRNSEGVGPSNLYINKSFNKYSDA